MRLVLIFHSVNNAPFTGGFGTIAVSADVLSDTQLAPLDPSFVSLNRGEASANR